MLNRNLSPLGASALVFAIIISTSCPPLALIAFVIFVTNLVSVRDRRKSAEFEDRQAAEAKIYADFLAAGRRL